MFKVITYPFFNDFLGLCAEAKERIILTTPFVKTEIVENIFEVINKNLSIELVTNINLESFHRKSSDIEAINLIVSRGIVYNHTTLHAKFFVFDSQKCLIISANLTTSGLKRNFECGVLTDDSCVVNSLLHQYNTMIDDPKVGKLSSLAISQISKILRNIPSPIKISYPPLDISFVYESDICAIRKTLRGWKGAVFELINTLEYDSFSTKDIRIMAELLERSYPQNHHREAKIRQVLQNLRDVGLIEFTRPGVYRRLWRRDNGDEG